MPKVGETIEEAMIAESEPPDDDDDNEDIPELGHYDNDSDSESGDTLLGDNEELEELDAMLNNCEDSLKPTDDQRVPLRCKMRTNARTKCYDSDYNWNLMNLSVRAEVHGFGDVAVKKLKFKIYCS